MGDLGYNKKMINFNDINWLTPGVKLDRIEKGLEGKSVCILIDNITVHVIHVDLDFKEMLFSSKDFLDGGIISEEDNKFLIKIIKEDNLFHPKLQSLASVLHQNPQIIARELSRSMGFDSKQTKTILKNQNTKTIQDYFEEIIINGNKNNSYNSVFNSLWYGTFKTRLLIASLQTETF